MRVLVACEFSGVVREAFRAKGHDAWSCDLLPTDIQGPHIQDDVLRHLDEGWELMIAHPPCTWICAAMRTNAARKDRPKITAVYEQEKAKGIKFFMALYNGPIQKIAVENPVGEINRFLKPTQTVRPFMFGEPYSKDICLWLKNLPPLYETVLNFQPRKKLDFWSSARNPNGRSLKSITFKGVAAAMAAQWG